MGRCQKRSVQDHDHKQALPGDYRLNGYRVVEVLGVGGFGVTYLADDLTLRRRVAIKEYLPNEFAVRDGVTVQPKSSKDRPDFDWGLARFLDEARTLAQFRHPNLVRVVEYFEANSTAYIVMDYEEGESLEVVLRQHGRLSEAQLSQILWPIVDGLRQVHAAGYLHRDIKPSNVYVRYSDQSPVLLDFGAARQALGRKSKSLTALASAGYSPPEQYESEGEQGPWTDIYALSALCYRAITGEVPMEAPRRLIRQARGESDPLPKLSNTVTDGYSPQLLSAVDCGLQTVETQRPGSLEKWVELLEAKGVEQRRTAPAAAQSTPREKSAARVSGKRAARWAAVAVLMVLGAWWLIPINVDDQGEEVRAPAEQPPVIEMLRPTNEDVAADALPPGRESVLGGGALLVVETMPEGVEVLLDGELVGVTPLELGNVRAGTHDVVLRHPEYETLELADESFADGRVQRIERTLVRATGALTVVTQPREAWVERDGVRLADGTPVTLDDLPAGSVTLRLGAAEYRSQEVVANVPKGDVGLLERKLEPIQYGTLTLDLEPADAVVMLPDAGLPFSSGLRLPEGAHRLVVSRQGYHTVERAVEISGETRVQISLEMDPQPFTVRAIPAQAQVELVEPTLAYAPGMRLEPGQYRVRVSAFGYEPWEEALRHGSEPTNLTARLSPLIGATFAEDLSSGGRGPEMVIIPSGQFRMGCVSGQDCQEDEFPVHEVTIPEAIAVSKYQVTFADWDQCVAGDGCNGHRPDDANWSRGNRPVVNVSWRDVKAYVSWLSNETGETYRLLSESEWEYAARAGSETAYSWGNNIGTNRAHCNSCRSQWGEGRAVPVGSFPANAFGLHDMHGNVWEWVEDCWNASYARAPSEGSAWLAGNCDRRVLRGGGWNARPSMLRGAFRSALPTNFRSNSNGFRVARTLTP